jgi:hypothetical protein
MTIFPDADARPVVPQQTVERKLLRITRDICDEIGANSKQIALLSKLIQSDLARAGQGPYRRSVSHGRVVDALVG